MGRASVLVCFILLCMSAAVECGKWTTVSAKGVAPSKRWNTSLTHINGKLYAFGGYGSKPLNDLHAFDLSTNEWTALTPDGTAPSPRYWHTAANLDNKLVVFGGYSKTFKNDVSVYDPATNTWETVTATGTAPHPRFGHTGAVFDNKLWVPAAFNTTKDFSNVHVFSLATNGWDVLKPTGKTPPNRWGHSLTVHDGKFYLFGGITGGAKYMNDTYVLDPATTEWQVLKTVGDVPEGIAFHTMASLGKETVMFGGREAGSSLSTEYHFEPAALDWTLNMKPAGSPPSKRDGHASDVVDGKFYVFGGYDGTAAFDSLHYYQ